MISHQTRMKHISFFLPRHLISYIAGRDTKTCASKCPEFMIKVVGTTQSQKKTGKSWYWVGGGKEGGFLVLDLAVEYYELLSFSLSLH
jgi:hypothetical protein